MKDLIPEILRDYTQNDIHYIMPKIIIEQEECIGSGTCESVCSRFFKVAKDNKSYLIGGKKNGKNHELEVDKVDPCIKEAVEFCPVQCIHIK